MFLRKLIIKGNSMSPTIKANDIVFASPLPYLFIKPKVSDIIFCLNPVGKTKIVKRITRIDKENYFITGDNLKESTDSRTFGPISKRDIIGKVVYIAKGKQ